MKIVIALATRGSDLYYKLIEFILAQTKKYDIEVTFDVCGYSAEISQRMMFLRLIDMKFDYCLLVDTDVAPPLNTLDKLLAAKKDIITAPVWHFDPWSQDVHLNVAKGEGPDGFIRQYEQPVSGIEEVSTASYACVLFSRKIFDRFRDTGESFVEWSPLIDQGYLGRPTDNILYAKVRKLGFPVFVDWSIKGAIHNRLVMLDDLTIENIQRMKK